MLRIALKHPCSGLSRIQNHAQSRLYIGTRYNSSRSHGSSGGGGGRTILFLVGTVTLTTGATVAYAKYDPEFRRWLNKNVPYSEDFIKIVLQEEGPFRPLDKIADQFNETKNSVMQMVGLSSNEQKEVPKAKGTSLTSTAKKDEPIKDVKPKQPEHKPARSVFAQLFVGAPSKQLAELPWREIRVQTEPDADCIIVSSEKAAAAIAVHPPGPADGQPPPRSLADVERRISSAGGAAVAAYARAQAALKEHAAEVYALVDGSVGGGGGGGAWHALREKTARKEGLVAEAVEAGRGAAEDVKRWRQMLDEGRVDAPKDLVELAKRNANGILSDVEKASRDLDRERQQGGVADKYWHRVEAARLHWTEEMEILFPGINLSQKQLNLAPADLDLFVLHAYQNVLFYQKELKKLETLGDSRLQRALATSGEEADKELIAAKIEAELAKERRQLALDYQKQTLALKAETDREMRLMMKRQVEAHADHITDAVSAKEKEVERRYKRLADQQVADEQAKYKLQLAAVVGRMRGMDAALKARADADMSAKTSQVLWSACQSLHAALKNSLPGVAWAAQLRPLGGEINAVQKAAAHGDDLVGAVVGGIPREALERGVFTEDALRERFLKVERVARQVALVPEGGGNLPLYLLSYLQSFLLVRSVNPIPQAELADQEIDVDALDTYDILQRARYWLDRGDFTMTLRYMNLLNGASRRVAYDWMNEARILLETQQAANTLMAHAASSGLLYL